jgi:tetratricopeptide (TPR) repeat protein
MPKNQRILTVFFISSLIVFLTAGALWLPQISDRLAWRLEVARVSFYNWIDPPGPPPTPIPQPTDTPGPTLTPTLTPTITPTVPGPTPTMTPSPTPIPASVSLPSPAWEKQDWNNCGPATLAMYLRFYGWQGDQFTISELIKPRREDRNVNVEEMIWYVRNRAGWLNAEFRVGGDIDLIKQFLAAGIPVVTEEGMQLDEPVPGTNDYWAAHYLLITGYDDFTRTLTVHDSFEGPDQIVSYEDMDKTWKEFNRVYILVYPPDREEIVKAILGPHWEMAYNRQHALDISEAEVEADPEDAFAWFNMGSNLVYFERYNEAARAYDTARTIGLPQRMMRYQFGPFFAYFHTHRIDDLLALAEHALKVTRNSEEALLWRGWGRFRQGDRAGAMEDFQAALEANPYYQDAEYAINFLQSNP